MFLAAVPIAFAASATVVELLLRAPQTFFHPQLFAEDGPVFFAQAHTDGAASVFVAYAGYLNLLPRLVALAATMFSAVFTPKIYCWSAVAAAVWSSATIASTPIRFSWIFGACLAAAPHNGEVFGVLLNVQWILAPALFLIVATRPPQSRLARYNQIVFAFVSALTGPFCVAAAPVVLWRGIRRRSLFDATICLIVASASIIQLCLALAASSEPTGTSTSPLKVAAIILYRDLNLIPTSAVKFDGLHLVAIFSLAIVLAVGALGRESQWKALLLSAGVTLSALVWIKFRHLPPDLLMPIGGGDRYFYIPHVLVVWMLLDTLLTGRLASVPAGALVAAAISGSSHSWHKPSLPLWDWKTDALKVDHGEAVKIPINPPGWTIELPSK
jgi:hypothetical protein